MKISDFKEYMLRIPSEYDGLDVHVMAECGSKQFNIERPIFTVNSTTTTATLRFVEDEWPQHVRNIFHRTNVDDGDVEELIDSSDEHEFSYNLMRIINKAYEGQYGASENFPMIEAACITLWKEYQEEVI